MSGVRNLDVLETTAARKRQAAGRTHCDGPGCSQLLTGQQVRWCGRECEVAYRKSQGSGVLGQPVKHVITEGDVFGHGVVINSRIRIDGRRPALLTCDCGPNALYAALVCDLVQGKRVRCSRCSWERKREAARQAELRAECAARRSVKVTLRVHGYEAITLDLRKIVS